MADPSSDKDPRPLFRQKDRSSTSAPFELRLGRDFPASGHGHLAGAVGRTMAPDRPSGFDKLDRSARWMASGRPD